MRTFTPYYTDLYPYFLKFSGGNTQDPYNREGRASHLPILLGFYPSGRVHRPTF